MKYTADCPSCSHEFEIQSEARAAEGLVCPKCETGFVPEKIHRITPPPPSQPSDEEIAEAQRERDKWNEYRELKADAGTCFTLGVITIGAAIVGGLIAAVNESQAVAIAIGSGCMSFGIIFFFFSQCLHIRAALQKLNIK